MQITQMRTLATPELEAKLDDAREELFKLRFQYYLGQLTDYTRLRATRRLIARYETVLRERQIAAKLAAEEKE